MSKKYSSPSLEQFRDQWSREPSLLVEGLWDAPKALLVRLLQESTGKNILLLTAESRASQLLDDAAYFNIVDSVEFPPWETLPGEEISPSPDIVGKRLSILEGLLRKKTPSVVVCPLQAALQKVPSPSHLAPLCKTLQQGDEIPFSSLPNWLSNLGYRRSSVVADKGEFALRGGILDIYPVGMADPYRIEFFGDTIDNIRTFDPIGQKSTGKATSLFISPTHEDTLLKSPASILDYLGPSTIVIFDDLLALEDRNVAFQALPGSASKLFMTFEEFLQQAKPLQKLYWTAEPLEELSEVRVGKKVGRAYYSGKEPLQSLSFEFFQKKLEAKRWNHPFVPVQGYLPMLDRSPHLEIHFICGGEAEEKSLREKITVPPQSQIERGYLSNGFALSDSNALWIPMTELTHRQKVRREKWRNTYHTPPSDFHELVPGDLIVHFHQGIGKYLGLEKKPNHLGMETEFLVLEYAENSKLYVPASQAYLVSRYIGTSEEVPTLHTLGSKHWQRVKTHAQKAIVGYAQDLLRISAERTARGGICFPSDTDEMQAFEEEFPYAETDDQLRAISEIKKDMASQKAMDRLLCGDVGYGKTEIAMRAAHKAILDGRQVAVLAPTTILAEQHFTNFSERFREKAGIIGIVSRFHGKKETDDILRRAACGELLILIGTHRLLSRDVAFNGLGLLILDEEQRFGVRQKEVMKQKFPHIDVLSLSATPIPRTLHMSMLGIRGISNLTIAPENRHPIRTYIRELDRGIIKHAIQRELDRGGQSYFLHNRIEDIHDMEALLRELFPSARIAVGHGQLSEQELSAVMRAFYALEIDIFLSTSIIANGIDIPTANTMIINNAHLFGLSELHQIRGRIGRYTIQAYCYLLLPAGVVLAQASMRRLRAIEDHQELGAGFKLAMKDMEIRGVGNILGDDQHGQISDIGYDLYTQYLGQAIAEMKGQSPTAFIETDLAWSVGSTYFPKSFLPSHADRIDFYRRISFARTTAQLDAIQKELRDRFGIIPTPTLNLLRLFHCKVTLRNLSIKSLRRRQQGELAVLETLDWSDDLKLAWVLRQQGELSFNSEENILIKIDKLWNRLTAEQVRHDPYQRYSYYNEDNRPDPLAVLETVVRYIEDTRQKTQAEMKLADPKNAS